MKKALIFLIKSYQSLISQFLPPSCKFMPSCSQYMMDGIHEKGIIIGISKGFYRIIRCNPFAKGGYDPFI